METAVAPANGSLASGATMSLANAEMRPKTGGDREPVWQGFWLLHVDSAQLSASSTSRRVPKPLHPGHMCNVTENLAGTKTQHATKMTQNQA